MMNRFLRLSRQVGLHLAPFVLLALGIMAALQSWSLPYFGALRGQSDDRLLWVDPTGPAAQADLRVGDVLLTIDGVPIGRSSLWSTRRAGEPLVVEFTRTGQSRTTRVILASPSLQERALRLSLVLIAFSLWLTGTVILFLRPRQPEARRFCLQSVVAAAVLILLPLASVQIDWVMRLSGVAAVWVCALLIDLHSLFPLRLPRRERLMPVVYGLSGILTGVYLVWDPRARLSSVWGLRLSNGLLLYFLAAVLIAVGLLARAYWLAPGRSRSGTAATVRRRVRLVLAGTTLALSPPCLLLFVPMLLGGPRLVPEAIALLSLVLIPLAYAYGIYRYNLMGIDFLINRVVVYLTLGLLLLAVYFAVALVVLSLTKAAMLLAGALASLIAVAVVMPLRQGVDLAWERVFFPDVYGYRGVLDRVSRRLSEALDYDHLAGLLVRDLCDAMDLEGAALLLVREEHLVLQEATGTLRVLGRPGAELLPASGALAQHLAQAGSPVDGDTLPFPSLRLRSEPALSPSAGSGQAFVFPLPSSILRLWVPLMLAGELQGVLVLGAKRTDEFFSPRDRKLLGALAGQAALAVKNVRLVAELKARMAEIVQDRQELKLAYRHLTRSREEERRRLAAELHDDVIQDLMVLALDIGRCADAAEGDEGERLRALNEQVSEIVRVIRRICDGLRPPVLDLGLAAALRSHLRTLGEETGLEVELQWCDDVGTLPEEVQNSLFRVAQEALSNVRRHAQASSVYVCLTATAEELELAVTDDGLGFGPAGVTPARNRHFGLRFMREHVEALGGQLTIDTRPDGGTTVITRVPRTTQEADAPGRSRSR